MMRMNLKFMSGVSSLARPIRTTGTKCSNPMRRAYSSTPPTEVHWKKQWKNETFRSKAKLLISLGKLVTSLGTLYYAATTLHSASISSMQQTEELKESTRALADVIDSRRDTLGISVGILATSANHLKLASKPTPFAYLRTEFNTEYAKDEVKYPCVKLRFGNAGHGVMYVSEMQLLVNDQPFDTFSPLERHSPCVSEDACVCQAALASASHGFLGKHNPPRIWNRARIIDLATFRPKGSSANSPVVGLTFSNLLIGHIKQSGAYLHVRCGPSGDIEDHEWYKVPIHSSTR